jgi:4-aminobutyrate aminotransferase/(S)-3-amino-2-methylpropionate transaminase
VPRLRRGDLPPRILHDPPGPASRRLARQLARYEAPGINTLGPGGTTLVWDEALGSNVQDVDGNRYIDLTAGFGVAAVGHRHPAVVGAVRRQSGRLLHGLADVHAHRLRAQVAQRLCRRVPVVDPQIYFAVSGSDAIEIALKTALLATGRKGILAFEPAYHGLSLGALQTTSRHAFRQPFAAHFHSNVHRLPFAAPEQELGHWFLDHQDTACVVVEPIVGREGVIVPPAGWLASLRHLCDDHGVLLIADEVMTGFGRTGHWFAVEQEGVLPDLLCCGKALGGGLPLAAVAGSRELMTCWNQGGEALHTGTFVANPLACASALEVLSLLTVNRLPKRAAKLGLKVEETLAEWPQTFPAVEAVRGRGLLWGVVLRDSRVAHQLSKLSLQRGVLALAGGPEGRVLQIVPPLVIEDSRLSQALQLVASALAEI